MADTRQIVGWCLERKCAFRSGDQWFLPDRTYTQLADLRTVASAEGDRRIVGGICVTSWTTEQDNSGKVHDIPHSGFRIEERLGPVGGLAAALATCRACEANAGSRDDDSVDDEGDEVGLMASLFATMYTPCGFRVVCEWP